ARNVKSGAAPSAYTWVNRHVTQPPPHTSARTFSTASVTPACSASNPDHGHDVSNVSAMMLIDTMASRPYGARRKEPRHAPAAPSDEDVRTPSGRVPPWSATSSTARA